MIYKAEIKELEEQFFFDFGERYQSGNHSDPGDVPADRLEIVAKIKVFEAERRLLTLMSQHQSGTKATTLTQQEVDGVEETKKEIELWKRFLQS